MGLEPCCERRTIASGRSRAKDGKRLRERQKSRQVTDLPFRRQAATAAVSPAVSQFAGQHGSRPRLDRDCVRYLPLTSIIFSRAFFTASFGFEVAPASQRSTCCRLIECFVPGSRTSTSSTVAGPIRSSHESSRKIFTARHAAS